MARVGSKAALVRLEVRHQELAKAISTWLATTQASLFDTLIYETIALLRDVVQQWPVRTGRSRAAWLPFFALIKAPSPVPMVPTGGSAKLAQEGYRNGRAHTALKPMPTVTVENNVVYALYLEARGRFLEQAMDRSIRRFIQTAQRNLERAAERTGKAHPPRR